MGTVRGRNWVSCVCLQSAQKGRGTVVIAALTNTGEYCAQGMERVLSGRGASVSFPQHTVVG